MEAAARWWVEVIRDPPRDTVRDAAACQPGNSGHQPVGVGVQRLGEKLLGGGYFYHVWVMRMTETFFSCTN
jgi:hypothetical protein